MGENMITDLCFNGDFMNSVIPKKKTSSKVISVRADSDTFEKLMFLKRNFESLEMMSDVDLSLSTVIKMCIQYAYESAVK